MPLGLGAFTGGSAGAAPYVGGPIIGPGQTESAGPSDDTAIGSMEVEEGGGEEGHGRADLVQFLRRPDGLCAPGGLGSEAPQLMAHDADDQQRLGVVGHGRRGAGADGPRQHPPSREPRQPDERQQLGHRAEHIRAQAPGGEPRLRCGGQRGVDQPPTEREDPREQEYCW